MLNQTLDPLPLDPQLNTDPIVFLHGITHVTLYSHQLTLKISLTICTINHSNIERCLVLFFRHIWCNKTLTTALTLPSSLIMAPIYNMAFLIADLTSEATFP
jgi:hypothetical protein